MPRIKTALTTTDPSRWLANSGVSHAVARDSNGKLWVVYREGQDVLQPTADVLVACSDDDGLNWTEEIAVPDARAIASGRFVLLLKSNNVPIVIYVEDPVSGDRKVMYVDRDGGSWGSPELIGTTDETDISAQVSACIDSGNLVHVTFMYSYSGIAYHSGSSGSWSARETLAGAGSNIPIIAVDSNDKPYIAYGRSGMRLRYKTGGTWQAEEEVEPLDGFFGFARPSIAIDSNDDVYVAYFAFFITGDNTNRYNKRTSGSWGTAASIASPSSGQDLMYPLITIDTDDNVYFIYQEERKIGQQAKTIHYKKLPSGGSLGDAQIIASDIKPPSSVNSSLYAALWAMNPSSCVLEATSQPVIIALDNPSSGNYDLYYCSVDPIAVTTQECTDTASETSTGHGTITNLGTTDITQHGHCWATSANPTTSDSKTTLEAAPNRGQFTSSLTGLIANTLYYVRAYATNTKSTAYGDDVTITTSSTISGRDIGVRGTNLVWFDEDDIERKAVGSLVTGDNDILKYLYM